MSEFKKEERKRRNQQRQDFLLTFFDKNKYTQKEVNGFWLVKQWNGDFKRWQVAIYPEGHLKRREEQQLF